MSATQRSFRMPPQVIVLDLLGTLLLLAGAFDLAGARLLGPVSDAVKGYGTLLVSGGIGLMLLGAIVLVTRLLQSRRQAMGKPTPVERETIQTVERRAR